MVPCARGRRQASYVVTIRVIGGDCRDSDCGHPDFRSASCLPRSLGVLGARSTAGLGCGTSLASSLTRRSTTRSAPVAMVPPRSVGLSNPLASQSLVAQSCHCNGGGHDWHAWKRDPAIGLTAHHQRWVRLCRRCEAGEERWHYARPDDRDPDIRGKVLLPSPRGAAWTTA